MNMAVRSVRRTLAEELRLQLADEIVRASTEIPVMKRATPFAEARTGSAIGAEGAVAP